MDRLARPFTGPDLLSQFRSQQTSTKPSRRRFEPRNMTYADGLDHWQLGGTFLRQGTGLDYSATTEDGRAILAAAVPEPAGFAFLGQEIEPDDYRGRTVSFRGELRADQTDGRAGLVLRVTSPSQSTPRRAAGPHARSGHHPGNRQTIPNIKKKGTSGSRCGRILPAGWHIVPAPADTRFSVPAETALRSEPVSRLGRVS
jgi:hypothetical protein